MSFMISPKVHRALYQTAIKEFIISKGIDIEDVFKKYGASMDDMAYSHLLDELIGEYISVEDAVKFLFHELNYGRMKNIYINQINDTSFLKQESQIIKYINNLKKAAIENADLVNSEIFGDDLSAAIIRGQTKLLYSKITKSGDEVVNISLLIADCIVNKESVECNNYYPIEINVKDKILIIRLKNWTSSNLENENVDRMYKTMEGKIVSAFSLELKDMSSIAQVTAYKLLNSLIDVVLKEPMEAVNKKIGQSVNMQVHEWANEILPNTINNLSNSDYDVLQQLIVNNYCKYYAINEIETIKVSELNEKYGVDGYPRYIRFIDDTVCEGRARSQDTKESLLQTSIFYDVKARLDQAKNIRLVTVYWVTCQCIDRFGLSIYTDSQGKFKVVFLPRHYNKEMYDYVLRQIKKYLPA